MKELNDNDFDKAFKTRITQEFPEFEEESWLKMERKLRKRDRFVFYRNASIILLFLSFGLGFYVINQKAKLTDPNGQSVAVHKDKNKSSANQATDSSSPSVRKDTAPKDISGPTSTDAPKIAKENVSPVTQKNINSTSKLPIEKSIPGSISTPQVAKTDLKKVQKAVTDQKSSNAIIEPPVIKTQNSIETAVIAQTQAAQNTQQTENLSQNQSIAQVKSPKIEESMIASNLEKAIDSATKKPKVIAKVKRKIPMSLAINAGPDFNSTTALIGGKTSVAFGISFGVGLTPKLSLQTGLGFGMKNYNGNPSAYTFPSSTSSGSYPTYPSVAQTITEINAACKVLEVPLLASYVFSDNKNRSISFNAGLSSYFMLKEDYVYKYTLASGKKDRTTEFTNANQHILSVVNLSATYNLKLKNKHLGFGIEPYVKIPLTGIGEGNVALKSSGVSLKLQYDFNKR